jgi:hypothetical protein
LSQSNDIEIVGDEVQVDVWLDESIGRVKLYGSRARQGAQEINNDGYPGAFRGCGDVPLERI